MDMQNPMPDDQDRNTADTAKDTTQEILNDGIFSIKVSEDMTVRNSLRRGLVEAQSKNLDRIPLFVSWPNWLDDGIVCLYAKDLHQLLHDTVQRTALAFRSEFEIGSMDDAPAPFEATIPGTIPAPRPTPETPPAVQTESPQIPEPAAEPYAAAPPEPATQSNTPATDQDIADQLFKKLKSNRSD